MACGITGRDTGTDGREDSRAMKDGTFVKDDSLEENCDKANH